MGNVSGFNQTNWTPATSKGRTRLHHESGRAAYSEGVKLRLGARASSNKAIIETRTPPKFQHSHTVLNHASNKYHFEEKDILTTRTYHTHTHLYNLKMASTVAGSSAVYERRIERVHKYHWPAIQLNLWMLFMLVASSAILGIFANFIQIQGQLGLGIPWYVLLLRTRLSSYMPGYPLSY